MRLPEQIKAAYSEIIDEDFSPLTGSIHLKNDGDGLGDYIAKWDYFKPIPEGLTLGKPSA
jgi:hypothetical protein